MMLRRNLPQLQTLNRFRKNKYRRAAFKITCVYLNTLHIPTFPSTDVVLTHKEVSGLPGCGLTELTQVPTSVAPGWCRPTGVCCGCWHPSPQGPRSYPLAMRSFSRCKSGTRHFFTTPQSFRMELKLAVISSEIRLKGILPSVCFVSISSQKLPSFFVCNLV